MHEATQAGADTGGHEYDRSAMRQHEMIGDGLGHLPGADQVVANDRLEPLVVELARRRHELAAGVVDQDIEPAELVLDPKHGALDLLGLANISRDSDGAPADLTND